MTTIVPVRTMLIQVPRQSPERVSAVITTLLAKAKNHSHPTMLAPFLGLACDVKLHLKNVSEDIRSISGPLQVRFQCCISLLRALTG